ncbi:hypothetical protein [Streptomyces sp. NPDC057617]|uniref:hypothetical protein n=1 Tax=Streptomyces sp. NPDC057617 TaxID=3346184 RepID=UPI00367937C4
MTSRLERHASIEKLRSHRKAVLDEDVQALLADLDTTTLVAEIEPLVPNDRGPKRHLNVRGLLLGMSLCSALRSGTVTLCAVADLLAFGLSDAFRTQFDIPWYPDNDYGFEAFYAVVRRLFHKIIDAIDPSPLPKNHRLGLNYAAELEARADRDLLAHKRTLLLRVANHVLGMSLLHAHPLLEGTWGGHYVVDATVVGTYAKGLAADSEETSTDPDAGWYVRTARHEDPLALDKLAAPPPQAKKGTKPASKTKKKPRLKKKLYGFDASLIVARDPEHDGAPLPDGSANPDVVPALIFAFSVEKPSHRPGEVAIEALQHVDPRYPRGYLAGDRLYNDQKPENFQLPIRAMGYQPVYDYAKDQLGSKGEFGGAQLIEGNWYCPSMPTHLVTATSDLIAKRIDKQTWIQRIRARTAHLLMPKEKADAEGHRRMMCPAQAQRLQCILKPHTLGSGVEIPLLDIIPSPTAPPPVCKQRSMTVPPEAGAALWQPLQYGHDMWQRVYFRLRNSIEGVNGFAKDPLHERLESAGTRRIRGIAAQTILLAFQLAHANRRKLAAWADAVALKGERPRRRPTRRRETKPIGTWTPTGFVQQT